MADTAKDAVQGVVDAVKNATIGESSSAGASGTTPNLVEDPETGEKISKTELKKRIKAREVAAKKAAKAAAAPKPAASKKAEGVDMSDLNPNQYFELRSRQIKHLLDTKTPNPYPHKFQTELDPRTFVEKYQHLKRGEYDQSVELRLGARIMSKREFGNKLRFYVTQSEGVTIQIVAQADHSADPEKFVAEHEHLQRGDIIGVVGFPGSTFMEHPYIIESVQHRH
jgi:lysyl-tRNA synthetase class 2